MFNPRTMRKLLARLRAGDKFTNERLFFLLRYCEQKVIETRYKKLWTDHAQLVKNQLVEQNRGLIHSCINRVIPPEEDRMSYESDAFFIFARCMKTFDLSRGLKWTTYLCTSLFHEIYSRRKKKMNAPIGLDHEIEIVTDERKMDYSDDIFMIRKVLANNEASL